MRFCTLEVEQVKCEKVRQQDGKTLLLRWLNKKWDCYQHSDLKEEEKRKWTI